MKFSKAKQRYPDNKIIDGVVSRMCSECEYWLPADKTHFYNAPDGLRRRCLPCDRRKAAAAKRRRRKNKIKKPRDMVRPKCNSHGEYICDAGGKIIYERVSIKQIEARRQEWVAVLAMAPWTAPRYTGSAAYATVAISPNG